MMIEEKIENVLRTLPFNLKRKALHYIEFLSDKYRSKADFKREFKFDWEGGLKDVADKSTSVELQHKVLDWR